MCFSPHRPQESREQSEHGIPPGHNQKANNDIDQHSESE